MVERAGSVIARRVALRARSLQLTNVRVCQEVNTTTAMPASRVRTLIGKIGTSLARGGYRQSFQFAEGAYKMAYSPEVARPNEHRNPPQASEVNPADDVRTIILNQVSWGAVFAGATIALVMQIILNMVGVGVGLSTVDVAAGNTPSAGSLSVGAGIWWVISGIVAAAVGGYVAGRLSGKASQSTTAYHGLIAWAVSTLTVVYLLSSAASGLIGGAVSTASSALGGAGKAMGGSVQTAVQTAAPSLNSMSDPIAIIENKVRSASGGGQDPAALRDAAATSVRAALSGDPAQQAAATDKAADALAKVQNIPPDQAKAQVEQYQQQYKEAVANAKEQAKQVADTTAKTVSRGALFGALALLLGALAAFFAGRASAVTPTVTGGSQRSFA
jgi:hypothetical protein